MSIFNPQSQFKYSTKIEVEAAQWTGENLDEIRQLLAPYLITSVFYDDIPASMGFPAYRMLKFYLWRERQEVDPGQWIVIYDQDNGEIMDNEQFEKMGFRQ